MQSLVITKNEADVVVYNKQNMANSLMVIYHQHAEATY
jgi:hypothetical protein